MQPLYFLGAKIRDVSTVVNAVIHMKYLSF